MILVIWPTIYLLCKVTAVVRCNAVGVEVAVGIVINDAILIIQLLRAFVCFLYVCPNLHCFIWNYVFVLLAGVLIA